MCVSTLGPLLFLMVLWEADLPADVVLVVAWLGEGGVGGCLRTICTVFRITSLELLWCFFIFLKNLTMYTDLRLPPKRLEWQKTVKNFRK